MDGGTTTTSRKGETRTPIALRAHHLASLLAARLLLAYLLLAYLLSLSCQVFYLPALAETAASNLFRADPSPAIRICSQNLHNYGWKQSFPQKQQQRDALVDRFEHGHCDVIAVQEVIGESSSAAYQTLNELAHAWRARIRVPIQTFAGDSRDQRIRNGFLVRSDRVIVLGHRSFLSERLPKFSSLAKGESFTRSPELLEVRWKGAGGTKSASAILVIINIHLKSRSNGWKDPTGTDFELLRMKMAEAVRRIAERELARIGTRGGVVILGDRNSDNGSPSAEILRGARVIGDYDRRIQSAGGPSVKGPCKVRKTGKNDCKAPPRTASFTGLFADRQRQAPSSRGAASYRYRGEEFQLDEILASTSLLPRVGRENARLNIGFEARSREASDHHLLWAEFKAD